MRRLPDEARVGMASLGTVLNGDERIGAGESRRDAAGAPRPGIRAEDGSFVNSGSYAGQGGDRDRDDWADRRRRATEREAARC